jgi:hypothetical protein
MEVAAVFIRKTVSDALSPLEGLAKLYRLSASEVRVFDAVLKPNGVKAIADLLGLSQEIGGSDSARTATCNRTVQV